jgi:hypothetical protein
MCVYMNMYVYYKYSNWVTYSQRYVLVMVIYTRMNIHIQYSQQPPPQQYAYEEPKRAAPAEASQDPTAYYTDFWYTYVFIYIYIHTSIDIYSYIKM